MVGKPVPPKTPSKADSTYKLAGESKSASPTIVQGAASAAAGMALQSRQRDEASGPVGNKRRNKPPGRLVSLDAFRGFIMMMLAATGFGIAKFAAIENSSEVWQLHNHAFWNRLAWHFEHPAWRSAFDIYKVSFWDLIQPAFMFMVGVAMPFSYARRSQQNHSILSQAVHAFTRSVALVLIGVFLESQRHEHTIWVFRNVLCQIGLGYFFAWCLLNFKPMVQTAALIAILVGYWGLFFFNPPPANYDYASAHARAEEGEVFEGRFAAWSKNANAAFFFDRWLLPKLRTVPIPDSPPAADAAAALRVNSDWQPVVLALLQNAETTEPTIEPPNPSQPPVTDVPVTDVPVTDVPVTDVPVTDVPVTDVPVTVTPAEPATPDAQSGPQPPALGWMRRAFLQNNELWTPDRGGYATLSFIPSIGTTLLGMLCGQLLLAGGYSHWKKLGILIVAAGVCLGLGIIFDMSVCPIVKRIWTPSWVLFSGGYVIGMLAVFYFLFDIAPLKLLAFPLVVVGMNSILIYVLGGTIGGWTRDSLIGVHFSGLIDVTLGARALDPNWYAPITLSTGTFLVFWLFLYWLHRQKIYLRL